MRFECPAPGRGGVAATFALDGSVFVRFTAVEDALAAGALDALERFGDRLAAGRDALAALRAAIDVAVAALAVAAAVLAAVEGGEGWGSVLRFAVVSAAYAALIPFRETLMRLALRGLVRAALRRATA